MLLILGLPLVLISGVLNVPGVIKSSIQGGLFIGGGMITMGVFLSTFDEDINLQKLLPESLVYFVLFIFSPLIFVVIKFLAFLRPDNEFIIFQTLFISMGEVKLESTPQLCLQFYIMLLSCNPTWKQILSCITSIFAIMIILTYKFVTHAFGEMDELGVEKFFLYFFKYGFSIILPNALFRILSISLMALFLRSVSAFIVFGSISVNFLWYIIIRYYFGIENDGKQAWSSITLRSVYLLQIMFLKNCNCCTCL